MGGPNSPSQKKGHSSPPLFVPCQSWPNGRPSPQLLSSCAKCIHTAFFDHATYRYNQLAGARKRIGQGAKVPGSELARVLLANSLVRSELAPERKGCESENIRTIAILLRNWRLLTSEQQTFRRACPTKWRKIADMKKLRHCHPVLCGHRGNCLRPQYCSFRHVSYEIQL